LQSGAQSVCINIELKGSFSVVCLVQICEIFDPRERSVGRMCINSRKQLTLLGYFPGTEHLTMWKMEGPTDYRPIHQEYFNGLNAEVWSDEDFIVLAFVYRHHFSKFEVRLISTTTFETERSFGFGEAVFHYDRGLLFVAKRSDDIIRSVPNNCTNKSFTWKCHPLQNHGSEIRAVDQKHLFEINH
jgi:hypothetical protein